MGFGGSGSINKMFQQQQQQMSLQMSQLDAKQAALNAAQQLQDQQTQQKVQTQFADAEQQTARGQAAAQLGILDVIKTSPSGLRNQPKTGRLTLLGN